MQPVNPWAKICSFLPVQDRLHAQSVSRTFAYRMQGYMSIVDEVRTIQRSVRDFPMTVFSRAVLLKREYVKNKEKTVSFIVDLTGADFGIRDQDIVNFRIKQLLKFIEHFHRSTKQQVFERLTLDNIPASFSALLGYQNEFLSTRTICMLSMNKTNVSDSSLTQLSYLPNLRRLSLDNCPKIQDLSLLEHMPKPAASVEVLSIANHTAAKNGIAFHRLVSAFPALKTLYFSADKDCPVTGLDDPITLFPINSIQILGCGHGIGASSWQQLVQAEQGGVIRRLIRRVWNNYQSQLPKCPICKASNESAPTPLQPRIVKISKEQAGVFCRLVDTTRAALNAKTFFHKSCGEAFNADTFSKESLLQKRCPGCKENITPDSLTETFLASLENLEAATSFAEIAEKCASSSSSQ